MVGVSNPYGLNGCSEGRPGQRERACLYLSTGLPTRHYCVGSYSPKRIKLQMILHIFPRSITCAMPSSASQSKRLFCPIQSIQKKKKRGLTTALAPPRPLSDDFSLAFIRSISLTIPRAAIVFHRRLDPRPCHSYPHAPRPRPHTPLLPDHHAPHPHQDPDPHQDQ